MKHQTTLNKQNGFTLLEIVIGITVISATILVGYFVWQRDNKNNATNNSSIVENAQPDESFSNSISLANESVTFSVPENWTKTSNDGCVEGAPIFGNEKLIDSVQLRPVSENTGQEPYFNVNFCVFDNPNGQTAQGWANSTDGGASIGYPSEKDIELVEDINGFNSYYLKFTAEEHDGLEDVYYVVNAKDKIVFISSRFQDVFVKYVNTPEGENNQAPLVYTQYEPTVRDIVNTLSIN